MTGRVRCGKCAERGITGESALQERSLKTTLECPLIGNGDSVIIRMRDMGFCVPV